MVIQIPVQLPQHIVQTRKHKTGVTPPAYVVIAYGLPDQPGPAYALTTGVRRLDVVWHDRHINDDRQDDGREHIQTDHRISSHTSLATM